MPSCVTPKLTDPMLLEMFTVGFLFYILHTYIDSTNEPRTVTSAIFEESSKLYCVMFLALGAIAGFIGEISALAPRDSSG